MSDGIRCPNCSGIVAKDDIKIGHIECSYCGILFSENWKIVVPNGYVYLTEQKFALDDVLDFLCHVEKEVEKKICILTTREVTNWMRKLKDGSGHYIYSRVKNTFTFFGFDVFVIEELPDKIYDLHFEHGFYSEEVLHL